MSTRVRLSLSLLVLAALAAGGVWLLRDPDRAAEAPAPDAAPGDETPRTSRTVPST
jgi:hypothetical protein